MGVSLIQVIVLLGFFLSTARGAYTVIDDDDNTCLYASFDVDVTVYRNVSVPNNITSDTVDSSTQSQLFHVPKPTDENVIVTGECDNNGSYTLRVHWNNGTNFSLVLEFVKFVKNSTWKLDQITFEYNLRYFNNTDDEDIIETYYTDKQEFFNRTFHSNEYFYCDGCKLYRFSNNSSACVGSYCAYLTIDKSTIYLGDFEKDNPKKKVCIEDWISAREIIVPIAVGGFLTFLVLLLIFAYIGTFIKRKFKERTTTKSYSRMSQ